MGDRAREGGGADDAARRAARAVEELSVKAARGYAEFVATVSQAERPVDAALALHRLVDAVEAAREHQIIATEIQVAIETVLDELMHGAGVDVARGTNLTAARGAAGCGGGRAPRLFVTEPERRRPGRPRK